MSKQIEKDPQKNPTDNHDQNGRTLPLTQREQEILELIGKGKTSKEIAAILELSTDTIGSYRKTICHKLDIHSTAELVYRAAVGDQ